MKKIKKFPVMITSVDYGAGKRSITMSQIEVCFIMASGHSFIKRKNNFDLILTISSTDYNKGVTIKNIPNGYINKFELKNH